MAKKRTAKTRRGMAPPPTVPVAPATPGGPNRQARKEEARRRREAIRRRMARRRILRVAGAVLAVLVVAGAISAYVVLKPSAAAAAGCGPVQTIVPYNPSTQEVSHIGSGGAGSVATPPALSTYRSFPPVSGPHNLTPLPAGASATPPDVYRTIHSLEHAAVVIWYRPGTAGAELTKIQDFYRQATNNDHVVVAPYNYPSQGRQGQLPAGKDIALVAWHRVQLCRTPSLAAAESFVKSYRVPTGATSRPSGYRGDAPEIGGQI